MAKLEIVDLHASVDGKRILNGVTLAVKSGEKHALMGPNGSGKSTLSNVIMGHPKYAVDSGDIRIDGKSILGMSPDMRARSGLFLAFQYPQEIPGVLYASFLRNAYGAINESGKPRMNARDFGRMLSEKMGKLGMDKSFVERYLNDGFSGGEKKRSEVLQMSILGPKFAILDEPDSGLDIDAVKTVAGGVSAFCGEKTGVLMITHYQRILKYVKPDFVHLMVGGRIARSGDMRLARELERKGYASFAAKVA